MCRLLVPARPARPRRALRLFRLLYGAEVPSRAHVEQSTRGLHRTAVVGQASDGYKLIRL